MQPLDPVSADALLGAPTGASTSVPGAPVGAVLLIDDDRELCAILTQYLALENLRVTSVHTGEAGVEAALSGKYALVLLDVMLPPFNGFEVLRRIRGAGTSAAQVPVLMLTARGDAIDRIVGLEVGADDYLPKPFDERELIARMRAILRRSPQTTAPAETAVSAPVNSAANSPARLIRVGDVELDSATRSVRCGGEAIELTALEFDLLALLLRQAGHIVTREMISREIFDRQLLPFDRSIDTHIHHLRRKLGDGPGGARFKTVRGAGYIYTALENASQPRHEPET